MFALDLVAKLLHHDRYGTALIRNAPSAAKAPKEHMLIMTLKNVEDPTAPVMPRLATSKFVVKFVEQKCKKKAICKMSGHIRTPFVN